MALLQLIHARDPGALLAAAADGFLARVTASRAVPFPAPRYVLCLRQGGLRDELLERAAALGVGGWFDPPLCLFQQLPELLGGSALAPCGDYERLVLLTRVVEEVGGRVFARVHRPAAFVDALDRLFGELVAEAVPADAFERAVEARADRDAFERARDADLVACYRSYLERLTAAGRRDGRDALVDCARVVASDPVGLAKRLDGRREIRVVGLQDLRGGWAPLLAALRGSPALDLIALYTASPQSLVRDLAPDEVHALDATEPAPALSLFSAPDVEREVEEVARRVRLVIEAGTPPHRIAVVARSARPYAERAQAALERAGLPATARRRHVFVTIPVVRSILSLFAVAREGWTRHGLVELAEQPYLSGGTHGGGRLDVGVLNHIGYQRRVTGLDGWLAAHERLLAAARARERRLEEGLETEGERRGEALPPSGRVGEALAALREFAVRARELEASRPLEDWVEWLRRFLGDDPWTIAHRLYDVPDGNEALVRLDATGLRGVCQVLDEWTRALAAWGGNRQPLTVASFESRLREVLSGDAALWTESRRGVQVLEALAASHRTFDHVFVVGLSHGNFPLRAPRSPILDDVTREALSAELPLESRAAWEARETALFDLLTRSATSGITLSWPRVDARGAESAPSAFADETIARSAVHPLELRTSDIVTPGLSLVASAAAVPLAVHGATIERLRGTGRLSVWNGAIEDPEMRAFVAERLGESHVWSATQLEAYARCPWAYFSSRLLRLDKLDDPDIDIDPITLGIVLHDALRRFYAEAAERCDGPVFLRATDVTWAAPLLAAALDTALTEAGPELWSGPGALRERRIGELRRMLLRFLQFEIGHNEKMFERRKQKNPKILRTGVVAHEKEFGDIELRADGVRFLFRGIIDRVEAGIDERVDAAEYRAAVDYKTSKWSAPGGGDKEAWEDGIVLQVPLYAYALTQLEPGTKVSRVEYRAIKQGEVAHSLNLVEVDPKSCEVVEPVESQERMRRALEAAARHVREARDGRFPARPAPSCMCPPYCHAWDICRVRGGPRKKW